MPEEIKELVRWCCAEPLKWLQITIGSTNFYVAITIFGGGAEFVNMSRVKLPRQLMIYICDLQVLKVKWKHHFVMLGNYNHEVIEALIH